MQYRTRYTPINTADKRHIIERRKRNGRWTAVIKRPGEEKARADIRARMAGKHKK